jgi:hypothetical protein
VDEVRGGNLACSWSVPCVRVAAESAACGSRGLTGVTAKSLTTGGGASLLVCGGDVSFRFGRLRALCMVLLARGLFAAATAVVWSSLAGSGDDAGEIGETIVPTTGV